MKCTRDFATPSVTKWIMKFEMKVEQAISSDEDDLDISQSSSENVINRKVSWQNVHARCWVQSLLYFRRTDNNILFVYLNSSSKCAFNESFVRCSSTACNWLNPLLISFRALLLCLWNFFYDHSAVLNVDNVWNLFLRFRTGYLVI